MKHLIHLTVLISILSALPHSKGNALSITPLFGINNFQPNIPKIVTTPLVQLQTSEGSILSFQQGAQFQIDDKDTITLSSGNLRIGPVGQTPIILHLPQGIVTVAPQTALTITVDQAKTTGRIYHGNITTNARTFTSGQGFELTSSGAHGTFTPAAAQAPAYINIANIEPAAGPNNNTKSISSLPYNIPNELPLPTKNNQTPSITPPATPPVQQTTPETESGNNTPPITQPIPEPTPEPIIDPTPEPEDEQETPPYEQPETIPEPEVLPPTPITRANLYAAFSEVLADATTPDNHLTSAGNFLMSQYADGTQTLTETQSRYPLNLTTSRLNQGTALNLDATSHGSTSGLGRWVGGQLVAINTSGPTTNITFIPNSTEMTTDDKTTITPNSLHYIWGETPSNIPVSGHITYNLFSATQPTYTGSTGAFLSSTGATFQGNLAIDFSPQPSGIIGAYHFNGTITMPETTVSPEGIAITKHQTYTISNSANGSALTTTFANIDALHVTANTGALACPSGCTGTINVAGFGSGIKDAGALYKINPTASTGIAGAAIFTATP